MRTLTAEPLFAVQNDLGEGPLWHPGEGCLYWVDIHAGSLYQSTRDLKGYTQTGFKTGVSALGFTVDDGFILATGEGFATWKKGQPQPDLIGNPIPERLSVRLNDGKVDPGGRFWAGSMDTEHSQGVLYRLDPDGGQHTLLDGIGISNGLGWSPDRKRMYYTDSLTATIYVFDYDLASGAIANQQPWVQSNREETAAVPDGLCVDTEGYIWSAQWDGWGIIRYDPNGQACLRVEVPAARVTSCCFGGPDLDQLFITTARTGLSDQELEDQPLAGNVFTCQTETQGQPVNYFGKTIP